MSPSHLFLGLPIALFVLYLELKSGFHSAALFSHLSLGDVAILSANFHFIFVCVLFQHRIFALSIFSMASSVLLFMYSIQSSSSINVVQIEQLVQIEQQAEARLSAYQVALLSGMNRSSECALGNQRRNLVTEAVDNVGLTSDRTRST